MAQPPEPKGVGGGPGDLVVFRANGHSPPGSYTAPKARIIIRYAERGKPYALLSRNGKVSTPQGEEMAQRVEEQDKKRMPAL